MPQKALTSKGRKSLPKLGAANRHGKIIKQKKGGQVIKPKKELVKQRLEDQKELTKIINKKNESAAASKAEQSGGHLGVVKAPAAAADGKDDKKKHKLKGLKGSKV